MVLLQSILLVEFGKQLKRKREDWRLQFWRGMEHGLYPDKRAQNLWKMSG